MDAVSTTPATPTPEDKAEFEAARKALVQSLTKKRAFDRQLAHLEVQIYNFEGAYLTDTTQHSGGNIIQGFDGYLKNQNVGRRRHEPTDADRVFSNSSLTYQKSLEMLADGDEEDIAYTSTTSRGQTPAANPTSIVLPPQIRMPTEVTAAQQKKMRDKEYQRRKRASAARERSLLAASAEEDTGTPSSRRMVKRPRSGEDD